MTTKVIFEIGPISDYLQATRKSRDLWGASFLFSCLMAEVAKAIVKNEIDSFNYVSDMGKVKDVIKRPSLENDQLFKTAFTGDFKSVEAGTIPDQLYCELKKDDTIKVAKKAFATAIESLFKEAEELVRQRFKIQNNGGGVNASLIKAQLLSYFRLFHVQSDKADFDELEKAAFTRSRIFEYNETLDNVNQVTDKYHRCMLCGDRKAVIILKDVRAGKQKPNEPLCAICTLKRGLLDSLKQEKTKTFPSTTAIAAKIVHKTIDENYDSIKGNMIAFLNAQRTERDLRRNVIDEWGANEYEKFSMRIVQPNFDPKFDDIESYIEYSNFFSNHTAAIDLRKKIEDVLNKQINDASNPDLPKLKNQKIWLNRPFFAIVFMDGDGMGTILRDLARRNQATLMAEISKSLSDFAVSCGKIIDDNNGKLFYAGGEDVFFMVHPANLLELVKLIAEEYKEKVAKPHGDQL